jgi:hypothetical protein
MNSLSAASTATTVASRAGRNPKKYATTKTAGNSVTNGSSEPSSGRRSARAVTPAPTAAIAAT